MAEASSRLQSFLDLMTPYQLEGRLQTSRHVVRMSAWRALRNPDSLVAQFDLIAFANWWKGSVICDLRNFFPFCGRRGIFITFTTGGKIYF